MKNVEFTTFLTSNVDIDQKSLSNLVDNCKVINAEKGDFLLREGEKCKHTFFVASGLLKQYTLDDKGKEHILQFAPENWFLTNVESVYFNQPSNYFIQAIEKTRVLLLDEFFITYLSRQYPAFLGFNNQLLHSHIRVFQKRVTQLLSATAEERYMDFVKFYPDVLLRIPQTMVASFLGITPESLSRIRRDLALKNLSK